MRAANVYSWAWIAVMVFMIASDKLGLAIVAGILANLWGTADYVVQSLKPKAPKIAQRAEFIGRIPMTPPPSQGGSGHKPARPAR